eukprot:jgi/Mesen1/9937/ME000070S09217
MDGSCALEGVSRLTLLAPPSCLAAPPAALHFVSQRTSSSVLRPPWSWSSGAPCHLSAIGYGPSAGTWQSFSALSTTPGVPSARQRGSEERGGTQGTGSKGGQPPAHGGTWSEGGPGQAPLTGGDRRMQAWPPAAGRPAGASPAAAAAPGRRQLAGAGHPETVTVDIIIQKLIFQNVENGYTVMRCARSSAGGEGEGGSGGGGRGGEELPLEFDACGMFMGVNVGQSLRLSGTWHESEKYGRQLQVGESHEIRPNTLAGITSSIAGDMVAEFGLKTLDVLDSPGCYRLLQKVRGIGQKTARKIADEWQEKRWQREAMAFLLEHQVPQSAAQNLVRRHGMEVRHLASVDPYEAAEGLPGWSFPEIERFAQRLGVSSTLPSRQRAAVHFVLVTECARGGHVYLPWSNLREAAGRQLTVADWSPPPPREELERAVREAIESSQVVVEGGSSKRSVARGGTAGGDGGGTAVTGENRSGGWRGESRVLASRMTGEDLTLEKLNLVDNVGAEAEEERQWHQHQHQQQEEGKEAKEEQWFNDSARCYNITLHYAEHMVAKEICARVLQVAPGKATSSDADRERVAAWLDRASADKQLSEAQKEAVFAATSERICILTGGPGCGKTYATRAIVKLWEAQHKRVQLCAPTGRAAQKLGEATQREAKTVHRLLECYGGQAAGIPATPGLPAGDPAVDAVVMDEMSMLDLQLAAAFLAAVPRTAQILFVGDIDQLPPVGPGQVLRDIMKVEKVPVVRLTEIFRQASESAINLHAHAINRGQFPRMERTRDGDEVMEAVRRLVTEALPATGCHDVTRDVQLLSPVREGKLGVYNFNKELQGLLNPPSVLKPEVARRGFVFRLGDRVLQLRNDYDREVYNGDLGIVTYINAKDKKVEVDYAVVGAAATISRKTVTYQSSDLDNLALAWAKTVHKSQGSEYPVVILPMSQTYGRALSRKLLYTAITRAKLLVIVVGPESAIRLAVDTMRDESRYSHLAHRLTLAETKAHGAVAMATAGY